MSRSPYLLVAAVSLSVAACGHSDQTRFFTLDPVGPTQPVGSTLGGPPIRLRRVTIPPALDRLELAYEVAPGEIKVSDFEHWAAPLGKTALQVLVQDLANRLPAGTLIPPPAPLPMGGVDVDVDILSFNVAGGQAVMQASWSQIARSAVRSSSAPGLAPAPPPRPQAVTQFVQLTAQVDASGGPAEAQGLSRLLGQLADRIAADDSTRR